MEIDKLKKEYEYKVKNINKIDIVNNELKFIKQAKKTKQVKKKLTDKDDSESE